jgi:hypothetical protein
VLLFDVIDHELQVAFYSLVPVLSTLFIVKPTCVTGLVDKLLISGRQYIIHL